MERRQEFFAIVALGLLLCAGTALAAGPVAPLSVTQGTSSSRNLSTLPSVTVNAQGGNITPINISALSITKSWQGYYGNVSGRITLDDANNKTFYNWSIATVKGQIYATRNAATDFTTVNCTTGGGITAEETYLGQTATDADSVTNTFTTTTHPAFYVGSKAISTNTCKATNAFGASGAQSTDFFQVLLSDANGGGNIVYTTLMNGTKTGFNNLGWNFELLVGQNQHGASAGSVTPYYFFVELS